MPCARLSAFLFLTVTAIAAEDVLVETAPARWRLGGELIDLGGGEDMGLIGAHYDVIALLPTALPGLYLGPGGYGAISGDRGGFFVVGGSLGWRQPLVAGFGIDLGGFAGGGGGASAGQGGGLMLRAQALAFYDLEVVELQAGVSHIEFPNGDIDGTQATVGFAVRDDALLAWPADGRAAGAATITSSPTRIAPALLVYLPDDRSHRRSGKPVAERIDCVGVVLDRFVGDRAYLPLELYGAVNGEAAGYMTVLSGVGWMQPLGRYWYLDGKLLAGGGGGGDIDTGGGLLLQPMLGAGLRLGRDLGVAAYGGRTWAPDGDFAATTLQAAIEWMPERLDLVPDLSPAPRAVLPRDGLRLDPWTVTVVDKVYLPRADVVTSSGLAQEDPVHLLGLALEKPLLPWLALSGRATSAFAGGVGGYSEGLFGVRLGLPLGPVTLTAHGEAGAGGGGGMDTGGGLIAQLAVGARWRVHGPFSLLGEVGRMEAREGTFSADVVALGVALDLSRPLWK